MKSGGGRRGSNETMQPERVRDSPVTCTKQFQTKSLNTLPASKRINMVSAVVLKHFS